MDNDKLERERTKHYELGRIGQFEDLADEFRERAGEKWATESRTDTKVAKAFKKLAQEFESRAEERRSRWEDKYDE